MALTNGTFKVHSSKRSSTRSIVEGKTRSQRGVKSAYFEAGRLKGIKYFLLSLNLRRAMRFFPGNSLADYKVVQLNAFQLPLCHRNRTIVDLGLNFAV